MKKLLTLLSIFIAFIFISCEEVIELDLDESEPRLVIEASIVWYKGTEGNNQVIKISETVPFYKEDIAPVENASVIITAEDGQFFQFEHISGGRYINNFFRPELNETYTLAIIHEDQTYTATEKLVPVTVIDYVEQSTSGGFSGDEIEIKAYYTDPEAEENYYLFKFYKDDVSLEIYEDEFTNGNQIFGYYSNEDIASGDLIEIDIQGISESYYEYLFILKSQVGDGNGGPFETMPATVKGNIINKTDLENFPFGYFRLSEADSTIYKVE